MIKMNAYNGSMNLNSYKILIEFFKARNYIFSFFSEPYSLKNIIYLRHDVDILVEDAVKLAELENQIGVKSTYFFLVNTNIYNLSSYKNRNLLNKIISFGHEIGLHYHQDKNEKKINKDEVKYQISILEKIIEKEISIISFHKPQRYLLNYDKKISKKNHTYMSKFFSKIIYSSDSRGVWKFGAPTKIKDINKKKSIQLLTHPEWWNSIKDKQNNREYHLKRIRNVFKEFDKNHLEETLTNYKYKLNKFIK